MIIKEICAQTVTNSFIIATSYLLILIRTVSREDWCILEHVANPISLRCLLSSTTVSILVQLRAAGVSPPVDFAWWTRNKISRKTALKNVGVSRRATHSLNRINMDRRHCALTTSTSSASFAVLRTASGIGYERHELLHPKRWIDRSIVSLL